MCSKRIGCRESVWIDRFVIITKDRGREKAKSQKKRIRRILTETDTENRFLLIDL